MLKRFRNIFANTEYSNFSDQMTIIFSYQDKCTAYNSFLLSIRHRRADTEISSEHQLY